MTSLYSGTMFMHYEDASMGSRDEEEQQPLTKADIRALLDEQEERINARHKEEIKEEIKLQEERINARHKEEMKLQDARHKEEIRLQEERINATHQEEVRALEEATDRRFKDLEQASASSSPPQHATNNNFIQNQRSTNILAQPIQRRGNTARFSVLMFQKKRNEWVSGENDDEGDSDDGSEGLDGLEEDTFSLMMISKPFREIPYIHPTLVSIIPVGGLLGFMIILLQPTMGNVYDSLGFQKPLSFLSLLVIFWVMMLGPLSGPWQLSMFTFGVLQLGLGLLIIADQTVLLSLANGCSRKSEKCGLFDVPTGTNIGMTLAQCLTVFFALATQNDIFTSLLTLSKLRNAENVLWDEVIGQKGNRTWRLWVCRILLPNVLKFIQAVVIIYATFVVIVQTTRIVDLLKDFTALLVVSEADNIMFYIADLGYFGEDMMKKTEEVKAAQWVIMEEGGDSEEEGKRHRPWHNCSMGSCVFFALGMVMYGMLTFVVVGQYTGKYVNMKYPDCNASPPYFIGSGICSDFPPYNTAECGWDGGDCPLPQDVEGYIHCKVPFPDKIGDKTCDDWPPYNTEACRFDGGDCIHYKFVVDEYPDCVVGHQEYIGNGFCNDFAPYNTPECKYDGGDCDPPQ